MPGTVAGLHLAWKEHGKLPWKRLVEPAVALARDGFVVTEGLRARCARCSTTSASIPARARSSRRTASPTKPGDVLKQPDLARTLERIADQGPAGFYEGETARLIEKEMKANGGLITRADLKAYTPRKRAPLRGTYRGYDVLADAADQQRRHGAHPDAQHPRGLRPQGRSGPGSADFVHLTIESMRRAFADRAR